MALTFFTTKKLKKIDVHLYGFNFSGNQHFVKKKMATYAASTFSESLTGFQKKLNPYK